MNDSTQIMNILEAYDLYQSYNQAAREGQCSPHTVGFLDTCDRSGPGEIIWQLKQAKHVDPVNGG